MFGLFRNKQNKADVSVLYAGLVARARNPLFYTELGVPDSFDGRFDLLAMHVHVVLRDLRRRGVGRQSIGQAVFDAFFADLDQGLREAGVGDLSVAKKIRKMAEAFYGRAGAYDEALGTGVASAANIEPLAEVFKRNIFADGGSDTPVRLAKYAILLERELASLALDDLLQGDILSRDLVVPF